MNKNELHELKTVLQNGELTIIEGLPDTEKRLLSLTLAKPYITDSNQSVEFFNLRIFNYIKLISPICNIPLDQLILIKFKEKDEPCIGRLLNKYAEHCHNDYESISTRDIRRKLLALDEKPSLIFIDQLENFGSDIKHVLISLKKLAKELDVPILVITELENYHYAVDGSVISKLPQLPSFNMAKYADTLLLIHKNIGLVEIQIIEPKIKNIKRAHLIFEEHSQRFGDDITWVN